LEFHRRVRAGYLKLTKEEPERWAVINATHSVEEVQTEIRTRIKARLDAER